MDESPNPILGQCRVTLSGDIFGEKNIARLKRFYRAVTDADLHRTAQGDTPLAARRVVPAEDIPVVVVLENQRLSVDPVIERFCALLLFQFFEVGFTVFARIYSAKLHQASSALTQWVAHQFSEVQFK
jgi:hypothetical protein